MKEDTLTQIKNEVEITKLNIEKNKTKAYIFLSPLCFMLEKEDLEVDKAKT